MSPSPPYLHLATSERKGTTEKNCLCYCIVYYYNGAQKYEQFLQVGRLYRALIFAWFSCVPSASVSSVFVVLHIAYIFKKFLCLHPSFYLLVS